MNTGCAGAGGTSVGAGTSPAAMALASAMLVAAPIAMMLKMLCTEPRCVSCAPFGKPVVPEV